MSTTSAVSGTAAMATAPPAANITAAANWVGAIARSANAVAPKFRLWASDQVPNPAEATAAHMHSTPAISMGSQYEPGHRPAHPAPCRRCRPLVLQEREVRQRGQARHHGQQAGGALRVRHGC